VTASKAKGTRAETAVREFFRARGIDAHRTAPAGSRDEGDIRIPDGIVEIKDCRRHELAAWVDETEAERENAGVRDAVLVVKRRGRGSPADWYAVMPFSRWLDLYERAR
jgi:hypothetical protein